MKIFTVLREFLDIYWWLDLPVLKILKCDLIVEIYMVEGFVCNSRSCWIAEYWNSRTIVVYKSCLNEILKMAYGSTAVWSLQWLLFLGTFAKLRKATVSFVLSFHLSIHLHGTTWVPLDRISWNLILVYCSKIWWKKF